MKGDFTRNTCDFTKHYQRVLMQQGRAQTDADWNECTELSERRDVTTAKDLIGNCGAPEYGAAFGVVASLVDLTKVPAAVANWFNGLAATEKTRITDALAKGDFLLTPGRYYVDGTQCELESPVLFSEQPDLPGQTLAAGTHLVYLDLWERHITAVEDPSIVESALGGTDTGTRVKTVWQVRALASDDPNNPFVIDPDDLCGSGDEAFKKLFDRGTAMLTADTTHEQLVTDPCLIPPSAGYTGLANRFYRVEIHEHGTAIDAASSAESTVVKLPGAGDPDNQIIVEDGTWAVGDAVEIYSAKAGSPAMKGQLAWITTVSSNALTLNFPVSGFKTEDEPKLRRIYSATAAPADRHATWKWSRENGSVVTPIGKINGKKITVSSLGPDIERGFGPGALAEISDDLGELQNRPGQIVQIESVDSATRIITLKSDATQLAANADGVVPERHPKLRRWEWVGAVKFTSDPSTNWSPMECGVQVRFAANGDYLTGHYWDFPARTATAESASGGIQWPTDRANVPIAVPPRGITHHFCRLGIVTVNGGTVEFTDCRCLFPGLTDPQLEPLGGDGQEVMPDLTHPTNLVSLPQPIAVYVRNLQCGETGVKLRFKVTPPSDKLTVSADVSNTQGVLNVSAAVGVIECQWQLDPQVQPPAERQVEVSLVDANDQPLSVPPPLFFTANLSIASQVAYDPANCANLADARTVQDAIDILCKLDHGGKCCCVTVGKEGDFTSLEEALTILIDKQKVFDICLCLLPGDHVLTEELKILPTTDGESKQFTHVRIAGCGRNTRLSLKAALSAHGLASFSLIDLTIVEAVSNPIIIQDCAEVTIKGCCLKQDSKTATDFLIIGLDEDTQWDDRSIVRRILIENNVIELATVNKTSATALVIADAKSPTAILNNIILGQVRFYGSVRGAAAQNTFDSNIAKPIAAGDLLIERNATGRDAQIVGNSFQGLVVDGEIVPKKRDQTGTTISGLFRRVSLLNNVIDASVNEWLGEHVLSQGNYFILPDNTNVGTACGSSFVCVATSANYLPTTLQYAVPPVGTTLPPVFSESANLITLKAL